MKRLDINLPYKFTITMHYETEGKNYREARDNIISIIGADYNKIKSGRRGITKIWDVKIEKQ